MFVEWKPTLSFTKGSDGRKPRGQLEGFTTLSTKLGLSVAFKTEMTSRINVPS